MRPTDAPEIKSEANMSLSPFRAALLQQIVLAGKDEGFLRLDAPECKNRLSDLLHREAAGVSGLGPLADSRLNDALFLAEKLFYDPTRSSKALAAELGLGRGDLVERYRVLRELKSIQNLWSFDSPLRRRVSFLRTQLLPENAPTLHAMFKGEVCLPSHVEFHPALLCNLRCRACPNIKSGSNGDLQFLTYPRLGDPLTLGRLRQIQDIFLDMGVESFSFGGGGEPSLSELTLGGVAHLRERSPNAQISLYTNGIFPKSWSEAEFFTLVRCLNKIRFSIDAADAQSWAQYKGRAPEFFEVLWENIENLVKSRKRLGGGTRIGASCLVSDFSYRNVEGFLNRARDAGLDFCDVKEVETCFGDKAEFKSKGPQFREFFDELMTQIRNGCFAPMDVAVDDRLLSRDEEAFDEDIQSIHCWVAIRGRMLTVGPYGELHPCSDAANPGSQERRALKHPIGRLTAFESVPKLREQFDALWTESLSWRTTLTRSNCAYCVPSHTNYNLAVEKLYQDWKFGIMPEDQPFAGIPDHYLVSRGGRKT